MVNYISATEHLNNNFSFSPDAMWRSKDNNSDRDLNQYRGFLAKSFKLQMELVA